MFAEWILHGRQLAMLPSKGPFAVSARPFQKTMCFLAHVSPGRQRVCEEPYYRISQACPQILAAVVLVQQVGTISAMASHQQSSVMVAFGDVEFCHAGRHGTQP